MRTIMWPGLAMQRLTTRQPDRAQIEVAIAALDQDRRAGAPGPAAGGGRRGHGVKPTPRWGPLPWFVLVLTLLRHPAGRPAPAADPRRRAAGVGAAQRGEGGELARRPRPHRGRVARDDEGRGGADHGGDGGRSRAVAVTERDDGEGDARAPRAGTAVRSRRPLRPRRSRTPARAVDLVVMRGRFDSAPPGGPPPLGRARALARRGLRLRHARALAPRRARRATRRSRTTPPASSSRARRRAADRASRRRDARRAIIVSVPRVAGHAQRSVRRHTPSPMTRP